MMLFIIVTVLTTLGADADTVFKVVPKVEDPVYMLKALLLEYVLVP